MFKVNRQQSLHSPVQQHALVCNPMCLFSTVAVHKMHSHNTRTQKHARAFDPAAMHALALYFSIHCFIESCRCTAMGVQQQPTASDDARGVPAHYGLHTLREGLSIA